MLLKRVISALVGVPLVFLAIYLGGAWFAAAVGLVALAGLREYFRMVEHAGYGASSAYAIPAALVILVPTAVWASLPALASGGTFALLLALVYLLFLQARSGDVAKWGIAVTGVFYVAWLLGHFILLRSLPDGARWIILALLVTWATDTGAYFSGRALGRHRLAPRISPKKTWEGSIGGLLWAVGGALLLSWLFGVPGNPLHAAAVGAIVGIVSQLGDLAESMLKRQTGVKDSGRSIPGHGGVLDRLDSLLFAVPVVYYYAIWVLPPRI